MARPTRGSLPLRVLAMGFLVFAVPLMVYFGIIYRADYKRDIEQAILVLEEIAEGRAALFEMANNQLIDALDTIEALRGRGDLSEVLSAVVKGQRLSRAFYIAIEEGRWVATASSEPGQVGEDFSGYYPLQQTLEQGQISVLGFSTTQFEKYLYAVRLVDNGAGFLVVARDIDTLLTTILANPHVGYPVHCSVLTPERVVYASGDPDLLFQVLDPKERGAEITLEPIAGVAGGYNLRWGESDRILVVTPIGKTGFSLVVDADRGALMAFQTERLLRTVVVFFLLLAVGGALALYLTQKMGVPLGHLREVMQAVSQGDLSPRFDPKPMGFEINQIGLIFNETVESLSENMAKANAERIQRETFQKELDIGQQIQLSILPHTKPTFPGFDIGARYLPAKQVGGDFYDLFPIENKGRDVLLTVADASGKGISACLYALLIRSMLRAYTVHGARLADIVRDANNIFCADTADTGMFVTAFSALIYGEEKRLAYTSQGHNPAYLRRRDGRVEPLQGHGLALGIQPFDRVEVDEVKLESGDLLLMVTDGVTEAHNEKLELFGEERLLAYLEQDHPADAEEIADGLVEAVKRFCRGHVQHDDITIMAVRVL
ncbi:MAG: PP2C family protein-serine/threonine phosphatase [Parachlamydiales bacterium]